MKRHDKDWLHEFLALAIIMGIIVALASYVSGVKHRGHYVVNPKWERWNQSYSPEADEPEPQKYILVEEK